MHRRAHSSRSSCTPCMGAWLRSNTKRKPRRPGGGKVLISLATDFASAPNAGAGVLSGSQGLLSAGLVAKPTAILLARAVFCKVARK